MNYQKSIIISSSKLTGRVKISGAKNSALRLLAASILTNKDIELNNFPNKLLDVQLHIQMLIKLGKSIDYSNDNIKISQEEDTLRNELLWHDRSIRNTLLILGALVTKYGYGKVPLPGGCKIGERKYDLHIMLLERLGANVWEEEGYLCAKSKGRLKGNNIFLPIRSTGATENCIIAGSLAKGKTTVWNPHIRPEIMDLIDMLKSMGAKIEVFGQKCIEINGVDELNGTKHTVVPDNMEAITWAIASTITGGDIEIINFPHEHLEVPLVFLRESGMNVYRGRDSLIVREGSPYPVEISTGPYPGINSDMQPLFAVYGAMAQGVSSIIDLRFPGRYNYIRELAKLGVKYTIEGELLKIEGGNKLTGTRVDALDLRAGMALLLAGLVAEGETIIENAWQIERGYENLGEKLKGLGVNMFKTE